MNSIAPGPSVSTASISWPPARILVWIVSLLSTRVSAGSTPGLITGFDSMVLWP